MNFAFIFFSASRSLRGHSKSEENPCVVLCVGNIYDECKHKTL